MNDSGTRPPTRHRLKWLLVLLVGVGLAGTLFRKPIQNAILLRSLLMGDSPSETAFQTLADDAKDPFALLQSFWETQKIPHRALVAAYLKENAIVRPEMYQRAESLLVSATMDVDASVRELALATLAQRKHPAVPRLAAAALRDADPQMRLLGLQHLRTLDAAVALPVVFHLLEDPDLRVVTSADSALRNWTKQDFRIRISHASFDERVSTNPSVDPANLKIIHEGVQHWKKWWEVHQKDYPTNSLARSAERIPLQRLPMAAFRLTDLNGNTVRFSDFKGKVVLLNFWTTWCTGCLIEMPDLIVLQKKYAHRLIILGISLDGQTEVDEHGEVGREATEKMEITAIRAKVREFVKGKELNYPILLDPENEVGRRFNGGELPTNVLIDTEGYVRRRFIGGRDTGSFEAMIEALLPGRAAPARDQSSTNH